MGDSLIIPTTNFDSGLGAFIRFIDIDECMAAEPMVPLPTLLSNATEVNLFWSSKLISNESIYLFGAKLFSKIKKRGSIILPFKKETTMRKQLIEFCGERITTYC